MCSCHYLSPTFRPRGYC